MITLVDAVAGIISYAVGKSVGLREGAETGEVLEGYGVFVTGDNERVEIAGLNDSDDIGEMEGLRLAIAPTWLGIED